MKDTTNFFSFFKVDDVWRLPHIILSSAFICLFVFCQHFAFAQSDLSKEGVLVCGNNKVLWVKAKNVKDSVPEIVWYWDAHEANDLPNDEYRNRYFESIDDCKPSKDGKKILITSSSSGVALVDVETKAVDFYAHVPNAHSAEFLPNERIVVAGSTNKEGNCLEVYDIKSPDKVLFRDSLYSGHGVVWDEKKQVLYALGMDELRAYQLQDWESENPYLKLLEKWKIPGESGHDLQPHPNGKALLMTEHENVWLFDKQKKTFQKFDPLKDKSDVKAVNIHPKTKRIAFVKPEESWWSYHVDFLNPNQRLAFPGMKVYKVRWTNTAIPSTDN